MYAGWWVVLTFAVVLFLFLVVDLILEIAIDLWRLVRRLWA